MTKFPIFHWKCPYQAFLARIKAAQGQNDIFLWVDIAFKLYLLTCKDHHTSFRASLVNSGDKFPYFSQKCPFLAFSSPEFGGPRSIGYFLGVDIVCKLYLLPCNDYQMSFWPYAMNLEPIFLHFSLKMPYFSLIWPENGPGACE